MGRQSNFKATERHRSFENFFLKKEGPTYCCQLKIKKKSHSDKYFEMFTAAHTGRHHTSKKENDGYSVRNTCIAKQEATSYHFSLSNRNRVTTTKTLSNFDT